ncbi:MAG: hypothetical protein QM784_02065 [Polyangiaceae bacterium]
MSDFKHMLKNFSITDEDRANLTEDQIARIEAAVKELLAMQSPGVVYVNPDKFDAKGMVPVGQSTPVDWNPKKPTVK